MKQQSPTKPPAPWPSHLTYLTSPAHSAHLTPQELTSIRRPLQPSTLPALVPQHTNVRIIKITDPAHPAYTQHGLFATQHLPPGTLILPYLGLVHNARETDPTSDYDLCLDRELGLSVDAAHTGNEARFINDYRGVPRGDQTTVGGPNAEFSDCWVSCGGGMEERTVGVYVLSAGKSGKRAAGIKKDEEILVSYGKGFWSARNEEVATG